jgi:hypothetical protein
MNISDQPEALASDDKLTKVEAQRLNGLEHIIKKGLKAFIQVADALLEIRDKRLYRKQYKSFEEYCQRKWDFTSRQANRLIGAGEVVDNLKRDQLVSPEPIAMPENEAQARPLTELTPPEQIEAARIVAAKSPKPTAKQFKEAAQEVKGNAEKKAPKAAKSNSKDNLEALIEVIDQVQTMVREDKPKQDIIAKLRSAAELATRINNGGAIC